MGEMCIKFAEYFKKITEKGQLLRFDPTPSPIIWFEKGHYKFIIIGVKNGSQFSLPHTWSTYRPITVCYNKIRCFGVKGHGGW